MKYNLDLLKEVLSVPTTTYKEDLMIEFLEKWLSENNIPHYTDSHGNVYATKEDNQFDDIWLCGPATFVFQGEVNIEI